MGKTIRGKLGDTLDTLWSLAVKIRAGRRCEVCKTPFTLNSHHVVGRTNYRLRWDMRNGVCLCASHHKFNRQKSAHLNPIWFDQWMKQNRLEDYNYLEQEAYKIMKWTLELMQDKKEELLKWKE